MYERRMRIDPSDLRVIGWSQTKREICDYVRGPLDRPLLLLGPRGVGKATHARALAAALQLPLLEYNAVPATVSFDSESPLSRFGLQRTTGSTSASTASTSAVLLIHNLHFLQGGLGGSQASALATIATSAPPSVARQLFELPNLAEERPLFVFTSSGLPATEAWYRYSVVNMAGYSAADKRAIAEHLFARHDELPSASLLALLLELYGGESGVLRLSEVARATNDVALRAMTADFLRARFGGSVPNGRAEFLTPRPGEAVSLAWSASGGAEVVLEATYARGASNPGIRVLGNCGDSFRDVAQLAHALARRLACSTDERDESMLVHAVSGNKGVIDGTSAGLAMTVAFYTLMTGARLKAGWALSGCVTLRGALLPVVGCQAKLLAAERFGVTDVILPAGSIEQPIYAQIAPGVRVHFARSAEEALTICLEVDSPS
jgi:ATP-dependent Lon protease